MREKGPKKNSWCEGTTIVIQTSLNKRRNLERILLPHQLSGHFFWPAGCNDIELKHMHHVNLYAYIYICVCVPFTKCWCFLCNMVNFKCSTVSSSSSSSSLSSNINNGNISCIVSIISHHLKHTHLLQSNSFPPKATFCRQELKHIWDMFFFRSKQVKGLLVRSTYQDYLLVESHTFENISVNWISFPKFRGEQVETMESSTT